MHRIFPFNPFSTAVPGIWILNFFVPNWEAEPSTGTEPSTGRKGGTEGVTLPRPNRPPV